MKKIFTENIPTKLMALVMAVALWLYAINRHTGDLTTTVSLTVSVPEGITIVEQRATAITSAISFVGMFSVNIFFIVHGHSLQR